MLVPMRSAGVKSPKEACDICHIVEEESVCRKETPLSRGSLLHISISLLVVSILLREDG